MDQTPVVVNASGDYIKNLVLGDARQGPPTAPMFQGSTDRMADFFHALGWAEGSLRQWNLNSPTGKLEILNAYPKPEKGPGMTEEVHRAAVKQWHSYMCGVVFMEALSSTPDRLVAQAAFDYLYPGKVGKR